MRTQQLTFDGFNQSCGMKLNPKDEWVILADMIDWAAVEVEYSALFKSRRGRPAASARMALGSLIIQRRANLSDRKLVKSPMAETNFIDKSILEKWYGSQPGGSLHDVYVVEIEGVYEG